MVEPGITGKVYDFDDGEFYNQLQRKLRNDIFQ